MFIKFSGWCYSLNDKGIMTVKIDNKGKQKLENIFNNYKYVDVLPINNYFVYLKTKKIGGVPMSQDYMNSISGFEQCFNCKLHIMKYKNKTTNNNVTKLVLTFLKCD